MLFKSNSNRNQIQFNPNLILSKSTRNSIQIHKQFEYNYSQSNQNTVKIQSNIQSKFNPFPIQIKYNPNPNRINIHVKSYSNLIQIELISIPTLYNLTSIKFTSNPIHIYNHTQSSFNF